ncbi:ROK family protein, partial [Candidatus Omnitrophota bacterium]
AILITLGTGVGCGLILNGRLFHGKASAAEAGHIPLAINKGRLCGCGAKGCIETFLGNRPFIARVKAAMRRKGYPASRLKNLTPSDIYQMALKGDKTALEAWREYGNILGIFLSGLINLLNPEKIVLGGGLSRAIRFFGPETKKTIRKRAMRPLNTQVKLCRSALGDDVGIIGAYELIKQE